VRKLGETILAEDLRRRRGPTENDFQPASVGVAGAQVQVRQLRLWRDTYYTTRGTPGDVDVAADGWGKDSPRLLDIRNATPQTLYVQPGHYLCLGDNSPESSDGRSWGLVPQRLLLGRALLVYYPFSRAGRIR